MSEPVKLRAHGQAHCKDCSLAPLCLPLSLNLEDMDALDDIVKRGRPLKKGEFLFRQGDKFDSVYAVRSGALKTFSLSDGGEEQITGFHLPSELVGLSGMDTDHYPVSAMALETTSVCEIPFDRLEELSAQLPQLRRQLMRIMSREIREDQQMMLLLSKKTWDTLSPEEQKIMKETAIEATAFERKSIRALNNKALDELKKLGLQVTDLPPAEMAKLRDKLQPVITKFSKEFGEQTTRELMAELDKARKK